MLARRAAAPSGMRVGFFERCVATPELKELMRI
jgi:hypothetical protein